MKLKACILTLLVVVSAYNTPSLCNELRHEITAEDLTDKTSSFYKVIEKLKQNKSIRSEFNQKKKIKILNSPLESTGKILFIANRGIIWEISKPYASRLVISRDNVYEISNINDKTVKTAINQPGMNAIYLIFEALFTGNIDVVKQHFKVSFSGNTSNWKLYLQPISNPLDKLFRQITLTGSQQIESIYFNETNLDSNHIEFYNIVTGTTDTPLIINAVEELYFEE